MGHIDREHFLIQARSRTVQTWALMKDEHAVFWSSEFSVTRLLHPQHEKPNSQAKLEFLAELG